MEQKFGANESNPKGRNPSSSHFSAKSRKTHLGSARDFLAGKAGASAQEPWALNRWPVIREQQVEWLTEWAMERGLWFDPESLGKSELGRMEHDLFPEMEPRRRMWKVTKGAGFGRQPFFEENVVSGMVSDCFSARPGSPLQYLERLCLLNERIFPEMNWLEGVTKWHGKFAILISQPFFVGRNATEAETCEFFHGAGFVRISYGTWFKENLPLAIFDAGQTNLIFSEGIAVPIDVIPIIPTGHFLERLREIAKTAKR